MGEKPLFAKLGDPIIFFPSTTRKRTTNFADSLTDAVTLTQGDKVTHSVVRGTCLEAQVQALLAVVVVPARARMSLLARWFASP